MKKKFIVLRFEDELKPSICVLLLKGSNDENLQKNIYEIQKYQKVQSQKLYLNIVNVKIFFFVKRNNFISRENHCLKIINISDSESLIFTDNLNSRELSKNSPLKTNILSPLSWPLSTKMASISLGTMALVRKFFFRKV